MFTPNGFAEVIRYRGRYIRVRTADGIHLNVSGTAIAAKVIAAAIRKIDGNVLGGRGGPDAPPPGRPRRRARAATMQRNRYRTR